MSRSFWAAALAIIAMSLIPGVALAAAGTGSRSSGDGVHTKKHPAASTAVTATRVVPRDRGNGLAAPSREVRSLQTKLAAAGFSPGPVDGRYGPLTIAAVRRFQQADGLVVDGIVGPRTRRALAGGGLLPGAGAVEPAGSGRVRSLQRRLARAGFSAGRVDGRYGPVTAQAVRRFQHARHLPANGIATAATLHALTGNAPQQARKPQHHAAPSTHKQHPAAKPQQHPASRPQHQPAQTGKPNPAPVRPGGRPQSGFPWAILAALALVAIGLLAVFSLLTRRRKPRMPKKQTAPPQQPPAAAVASQDPATPASAEEIAALEAAVAMPSAGSPATPKEVHDTTHSTVHVPAPLPVDKPEPVELSEERFERVKTLQRQLTWLGFEPGLVDGRYGPITTEAVRCFQEVRGLHADGVADAATLSALRAGTPERPFSGRAERVKELQRELTGLGFEPGMIDGRYGPATTEAVKRFQKARDLPVDGIADQATIDALRGRTPEQPFTRRKERVTELQSQLSALGLEPGLIDGRYGPMTTEAVRRFQRAYHLPIDGVADPVTLNALRASAKASPFTVRNERVKELQSQLIALGFEPGLIDGRYGPVTTDAVRRFQEANDLPADGIADPETLDTIRSNAVQQPERELTQHQD
jgi:peptidoglycan hydrolase-like protein with peptidoglycan-binding domain